MNMFSRVDRFRTMLLYNSVQLIIQMYAVPVARVVEPRIDKRKQV